MLSSEAVFDAFGHISMRHPNNPRRYFMARWRLAAVITADDILEFGMDSEPVRRTDTELDPERVIDGCIYQARPDVIAVCHHHAAAILPFCVAGVSLPVDTDPNVVFDPVPIWNAYEDFGDTDLRITTVEQGQSLARTLGRHMAVLMRHHGATIVGRNLDDVVSRSIQMCAAAKVRLHAFAQY
jgi:ribulose-5-phosphate 4-epimerase/fuculose-1-phosphate aldolase